MWVKQQKLRVGLGQKNSFLEKPLAPSRGQERHKGWEQGQGNSKPSKAWQVVNPRGDLVGQMAVFKSELPHLAEKIAAERSCSCCLVKTATALTTCKNWQTYLTSQLQLALWKERNQILLAIQSPGETTSELPLYANTRIGHLRSNSRTFTKTQNFLFSCAWYF
jgi:hypothetical protein